MQETAKQIRQKLKELGYTNRDVSVKCKSNFTIHVESKNEIKDLKEIVQNIYWQKDHAWLCVRVNYTWLPMPKPTTNLAMLVE